jgi:hypothetical protein
LRGSRRNADSEEGDSGARDLGIYILKNERDLGTRLSRAGLSGVLYTAPPAARDIRVAMGFQKDTKCTIKLTSPPERP